jgi:DNA-binding LacI/PurR family transcriptional regulator
MSEVRIPLAQQEHRARVSSIRDVARLAGVSHQTVSRVVNEHHSVREETRKRVLDAIVQLDYRPNLAARALVTNSLKLIGVLSATTGEFGATSSLTAIEEAAREAGYSTTTLSLPDVSAEAIRAAVRQLQVEQVDGLIALAPQARVAHVLAGMRADIPIVTLQTASGASADTHAEDQVSGARMATEHLIALGHRDIVHLAGPQDWIEAESRMRGYLDAMLDADLTPFPPLRGDWTADFGHFAGVELAQRGDFSAVLAANDAMAIGLMHGFRDAGLDVPRDVSVVGFDDIPVAKHVAPALTTVHQDFRTLGQRALLMLLAEIRGEDPPQLEALHPRLVVRDSSGPPR